MTRARTLADMISDGVIGTTELADDAITPVKLDETGSYQVETLGVGTAPLENLTVENTHISDSGNNSFLRHNMYWNGSALAITNSSYGTSQIGLNRHGGGHITFATGAVNTAASEKMRLTGDGNFGFNTTSPAFDFDINGQTRIYGADNGILVLDETNGVAGGAQSTYVSFRAGNTQTAYTGIASSGGVYYVANKHGPIQIMTGPSGTETSRLLLEESTEAVFNDTGANYDFRVESDSETHMLFVDAALNRVGIGTNGPASTLSVDGDILSNWGNSGEQKIGIAGRTANIFSTTGRTLILTGADAIAGAQAMAGGDVIVRGGKGRANTGLNTYAGHLYLEGGEHTTSGETGGAGNVYIKTAGNVRATFHAGGDVAIPSTSASEFFKIDHSANDLMVGTTGSNDGGTLTLGEAGQASYSTSATEGMAALVRFNNTGNANQHSGMMFRVTSNNGSNNANASIGAIQTSSGSHNTRFYFNVRSQSQNKIRQYGHIDSENGWVFNDGSENYIDFRVESDTDTHAIFVDAGNNRVNIHASSGENLMNLNAAGVSSHTSGTLPPGLTLYNSNTGNGTGNAITWKDATGAQGIAGIASFRNSNAGGYARDLRFYVNNAAATNAFQERLRIDRDGNVMMGNTLDFPSSNFRTQSGFRFRQAGDANYLEQIRTTTSDSSANFYMGNNLSGYRFFSFNNSASQIGSISNSGNNSVSYNTTSDYRLKENVEDIADGITRVKQLQPRRFSWISEETDAPTVDGFIAHEAQTVVPEAVHGTHNEVDDDGNPVYQGIDQAKLVPLLTAALQEAITKIETLETQRADMEARLTALESA